MKSPISSDFNKINYHQEQQRQYQNVKLINEVLTSWVRPQKKKKGVLMSSCLTRNQLNVYA